MPHGRLAATALCQGASCLCPTTVRLMYGVQRPSGGGSSLGHGLPQPRDIP